MRNIEATRMLRRIRALNKKLKGTKGLKRKELLNKRSTCILAYIKLLRTWL